MATHHSLDISPIPEKVLYINETELADITALNDYPPDSDGKQNDNVRVYVPLDLNHRAIIRRLNDIYRRYKSPDWSNESSFWQETNRLIAELEIYDQVWSVREGVCENGHSKKATDLAIEMISILESDEGSAECFPFEKVEALREEYEYYDNRKFT